MPYIKKIELKGFKSFGPQTVKVALDKGFTAITGPNGSGKTTLLKELTRQLNAEGTYHALYCSLEALKRISDAEQGGPIQPEDPEGAGFQNIKRLGQS